MHTLREGKAYALCYGALHYRKRGVAFLSVVSIVRKAIASSSAKQQLLPLYRWLIRLPASIRSFGCKITDSPGASPAKTTASKGLR